MRRAWIYRVLAVLCLATVVGVPLSVGAHTPTVAHTPTRGPLVASGTVRTHEIRVAAELGGRIVVVHADEGDGVRAGDLLVEL